MNEYKYWKDLGYESLDDSNSPSPIRAITSILTRWSNLVKSNSFLHFKLLKERCLGSVPSFYPKEGPVG